jgi:hypothetical protein
MLIEQYPNAVPVELCREIVACFERDPARKASAVVVAGGPAANEARTGTQLTIDRSNPEWERLFMAVAPALRKTIDAYIETYPGLGALVDWEGIDCTVPMIERVDPGQGFDWHYDQTASTEQRVVAGLLYLSTIADGGHTEFLHQRASVQPEAGKIVLFPPFWTHIHRGATPAKGVKYVMSYFWIYPRNV